LDLGAWFFPLGVSPLLGYSFTPSFDFSPILSDCP
jgi:hypothetical protein